MKNLYAVELRSVVDNTIIGCYVEADACFATAIPTIIADAEAKLMAYSNSRGLDPRSFELKKITIVE